MDWHIQHLIKGNGKWKRKRLAVLVCGRCGELDRADKVEAQERCPFCGFDYSRGCEE